MSKEGCTYTIEEYCSSGNHNDSIGYGDCGIDFYSIVITETCTPSGGGGAGSWGDSGEPEGNDTGSTNTGDTSGSQTNNGGTSSNGGVTTPTTPQPWEKVDLCLSQLSIGGSPNGFTAEMSAWLQSQPKNVVGQISNFIDKNECSETAQAFAIEAIITLMNGGEVDFNFEMIIEINETIEFQSQTCLKTIKDDVIATNQMSKIIKKFEPENPVLHLEWGIFQSDNWGNTGHTGLDDTQTLAYININSESLSYVSNIVMVKTIAHKIIHAELYRKLKEIVDDYQILSLAEYNALEDNYLGIADYTFSYGTLEYSQSLMGNVVTWGLTPNYTEAHHNQMASFYRSVLIDTMKAYDLSKNVTRDNPEQFYEAMSWAGLRSFSDESGNTQFYDAWEKFKDSIDILENSVPEPERTYNIYSNIINEQYNNSGINCN
ncbi:hypothetical protein ES677_14525 [Bizionia gelidisalsuginis]|uniref:Uncharacterized protein n=1 Tax=Bizionia gelidisalsuginis TaxID=291188 RepID=A0ABY3M713_9FLAO|nr:hypothetical protein [Bizionia gelidisalsuginis]TYC08420.1 hypothetical protein ES677_14525 [Bizionia gelidisalsuginis]